MTPSLQNSLIEVIAERRINLSTPGPWSTILDKDGTWKVVDDEVNARKVGCGTREGLEASIGKSDTAQANAKLMAAAPELLSVLRIDIKHKRGAIPKKKKLPIIDKIELEDLKGSKIERLQELYGRWHGCQKCFLGQNKMASGGQPDIVFGDGNPDAHIMIVGEAPGDEEEATSIPFIGPAGRLLNQMLVTVSADPDIKELLKDYYRVSHTKTNENSFHEKMFEWRQKEFFVANAVACRPPENRPPNNVELKTCWERLRNIIYIIDPMLIIVCGNSALSSVMQKTNVRITQDRGKIVEAVHEGVVGPLVYPVMPVYHPAYLLRKGDWKTRGGDYEKTVEDLRVAMRIVDFLREKHFGTPVPSR